MIYIIVPHVKTSWDDVRVFTSYSAAEQAVLTAAKGFAAAGYEPDWCLLVAYEGVDELRPVFLFTISDGWLYRQPYPTPSP